MQKRFGPDYFLMLSEKADELSNRVSFLELLLLLFKIEAPLIVY